MIKNETIDVLEKQNSWSDQVHFWFYCCSVRRDKHQQVYDDDEVQLWLHEQNFGSSRDGTRQKGFYRPSGPNTWTSRDCVYVGGA